MATTHGERILALGRKRLGDRYVLGAVVPKNNPKWSGPWDCAEFVSWLVYQVGGVLYGCHRNSGDAAKADAYTGYWGRDAREIGERISVAEAARTPGAALLRLPQSQAIGHIAVSDGSGGTVEAHSARTGVIAGKLAGRRWDMGVLVPGLTYIQYEEVVDVPALASVIYRLKSPAMKGAMVREIQRALKTAGVDPGRIDGVFGPMTQAAVISIQATRGLVADGEVGPVTAKALGITLPQG
jgi:N-acetylmuramoyl-L-alanine amidase